MTVVVPFLFLTKGRKLLDFIYILEWTSDILEPFNYLEKGAEAFIKRDCIYQNCILTSNRSYLEHVSDFDAFLFNACHLTHGVRLPLNRTSKHHYVLIGIESAVKCPISSSYDDIFNATMTYKLDSDIPFKYVAVKNHRNKTIGPKTNMHWKNISDMAPINNEVLNVLQEKSVAAAWIVSNCDAKNNRLDYVQNLNKELSKYGHRVDIYGRCGNLYCETMPGDRNGNISRCSSKIKANYYFYLAFENSFADDYVTEKILHGLRNFAVPIVYGGANYTRFMPQGIYLNAMEFEPKELAKEMNDIIINKDRYYDFFRWHDYYTFHDTADDLYRDAVCGLCALLNNKKRRKVYTRLSKWWNIPGAEHLADKDLYLVPPYDINETLLPMPLIGPLTF